MQELSPGLLNIYPNPLQKQLTINYKAAVTGTLKINIHNILGTLVYSEVLEEENGEYAKEIELSGQPEGIYLVELLAGDRKINRKIVKQ